jgi:hypothetical protein
MTQYFKSFDLILDVKRKEEQISLFKKLINSFSCKKRPATIAMENIRKMYKTLQSDKVSKGSAFRVINNQFDYELLHALDFRHFESNNKFNLMRDFEQLVKLLQSFCDEPRREKEYDIEITIEVPKPKKLRKVTTYEKITILERWVKIGYKMYRRHFDSWTGDSYIVVDGDVYNIKCDRYGTEFLA